MTALLQSAGKYAETAASVASQMNAVRQWAGPLDRLQKVMCSVGPVSGWTIDTVQLLLALLRACTAWIKQCKVCCLSICLRLSPVTSNEAKTMVCTAVLRLC